MNGTLEREISYREVAQKDQILDGIFYTHRWTTYPHINPNI